MANIKSKEKRILTNEKSRMRNKSIKSAVKTSIKKAQAAKQANDPQKEELINNAVSVIDKSVSKGVLNKNKAAREKSRLMSA